MKITKKRIGYLIQANLEDRGMRQKDLASRLSVSASTVCLWCTGSTSPSIEMLSRICEVFNLSICEFLQSPDGPDGTEWLKDDDGVWFCKKCRMDAPYDRTGYQHRPMCCPYCGRRAYKKEGK